MTTSPQTLSVVLSVHNAEKTLSQQVDKLLDMLPDLTQRFELLILDDGSTDQTEEVAYELAKDYPQMRVARHNERMGTEANLKTALEKTTGDVVLLQDEQATDDLRFALQECGEEGIEFPAGTTPTSAETRSAITTDELSGANPDPSYVGGIHMIRRRRQADWIIARRADAGSRKSPPPFGSRRLSRV